MTDSGVAMEAARAVAPRRGPVARLLVALPLFLAVIAEAAWISVVAGLVQEFALREPSLGIAPLVAFVAAGVVTARTIGARLGERWPLVAAVLCASAGVVGWLSSPDTRAALLAGGVAAGLATHPGGWLAGLAFARGFAHARLPLSEPTLGRLLGAGIPGIAIAAAFGGMVADPFRGQFLANTVVASIVFATSATLALALTRLSAVGADSGFDWRRNPTWVGLLTTLVVATAVLAILVSSIAAPVIAFVIGASIAPLLLIGLVLGFNRGTVRILAIAMVAALIFAALMRLLGGQTIPVINLGAGVPSEPVTPAPPEAVAVSSGLLLIVALIAIVILARLWMRRIPLVEDDVPETRMIDRGVEPTRRRRRGRPRRTEPIDAVTAYLALMDDLADQPRVSRQPAETPAEHAGRLRVAAGTGLELDLLAADYELARFGGVHLSDREDRRAIGRWRSLRQRLAGPSARRPTR